MLKRMVMISVLILCVLTGCMGVNYSNFYQGINEFRSQSYRDAFIRLKPEAEKGQPDAQYAVGYMYYYGQGVVENRAKAWYWITKAARAGQPEAIQAAQALGHPIEPTSR